MALAVLLLSSLLPLGLESPGLSSASEYGRPCERPAGSPWRELLRLGFLMRGQRSAECQAPRN